MRLQRLTALEADKIKEEHKELTKLIKELRAILADETKVLGLVKSELSEIAETLRRRAADRDHRRRGRARHRGRDRRPADGGLDHRLRLREAHCRSPPTASSAAAVAA